MSAFPAIGGVTPRGVLPVDAFTNGASTVLNITAETLLKASPGRLVRIDVIVAGSAPGAAL